MKTLLRPLLCCALLLPFAAAAAPDRAFEAAAFLAGHCWKGTMPDGKATDEHCFSWIYDGKFLRDRHVVRAGDKTVYEGETVYYWSPGDKRIEYLYITAQGGVARGVVTAEADTLVFPATSLVSDTRSSGFRGRLKRVSETAYEIVREYDTAKGWVPVTIVMNKVEK